MNVNYETPTDATDLLRQRGKILAARRLESEEKHSLGVHVLVSRGDTRMAIPIERCIEVRRVTVFLTPGTTAVMAGVFQIRTRPCSLIDLAGLEGTATAIDNGSSSLAVVMSGQPGHLGLRIDTLDDVRDLAKNEVDIDLSAESSGFIAAVTREMVQIIDVDVLMSSPVVRISLNPPSGSKENEQ